jgi:hypothetical protein
MGQVEVIGVRMRLTGGKSESPLERGDLTRPLQPPTALHTSPLPGATHLFLDSPLEHVLERLVAEVCHITLPGARECLPSADPS